MVTHAKFQILSNFSIEHASGSNEPPKIYSTTDIIANEEIICMKSCGLAPSNETARGFAKKWMENLLYFSWNFVINKFLILIVENTECRNLSEHSNFSVNAAATTGVDSHSDIALSCTAGGYVRSATILEAVVVRPGDSTNGSILPLRKLKCVRKNQWNWRRNLSREIHTS